MTCGNAPVVARTQSRVCAKAMSPEPVEEMGVEDKRQWKPNSSAAARCLISPPSGGWGTGGVERSGAMDLSLRLAELTGFHAIYFIFSRVSASSNLLGSPVVIPIRAATPHGSLSPPERFLAPQNGARKRLSILRQWPALSFR